MSFALRAPSEPTLVDRAVTSIGLSPVHRVVVTVRNPGYSMLQLYAIARDPASAGDPLGWHRAYRKIALELGEMKVPFERAGQEFVAYMTNNQAKAINKLQVVDKVLRVEEESSDLPRSQEYQVV